MQSAFADHSRQVLFFFSERRWRLQPFDLNRQFTTDENFAPGNVPLHVRRFETVFVKKKAARPHNGRGAITRAANLVSFELLRMVKPALTVKDVALARPALKKDRQGDYLAT